VASSKTIYVKPIAAKARPKGENVVDLMEALKLSIDNEAQAPKGKKPRKAAAGRKEMLLPTVVSEPPNKGLRKPTSPQRREVGSVRDRSKPT
jgi:DNA end-binding protein Ku